MLTSHRDSIGSCQIVKALFEYVIDYFIRNVIILSNENTVHIWNCSKINYRLIPYFVNTTVVSHKRTKNNLYVYCFLKQLAPHNNNSANLELTKKWTGYLLFLLIRYSLEK
jgi:hypothetical protein